MNISQPTALYYFFTDHLGSTTLLADETGNPLPDTVTHYLPFGSYRSTPPNSTLTDRGFTGHKHNDNLGLIYMNARYYLPAIGRFLSADTIVPNPSNPQSFNRYSYTLNNPLRYTDPTGHVCYDPGLDAVTEGNCDGKTHLVGTPDPIIVKKTWQLIYELEQKGYLKDGYIVVSYRSPEDAHRFSTAYNLIHGNLAPQTLRDHPVDLDGNIWFQDEWAYYGMGGQDCTIHPYGCVLAFENAAVNNSPETIIGGSNCSQIKLTAVGHYCGPVTSYALEGYPPGDPHRLPNTDDIPMSQHVNGLAVDIGGFYWHTLGNWLGPKINPDRVWDPRIDAIAAEYGLWRPYHRNLVGEGTAEFWHFELIP